ncbi:MAG: hypothetical protein LBB62_02925 [Proteiniphilum sp.]|jgi:hypothetical protein|nr:hypothetical protein [Proteiniphilum sp.]
MLQEERMCNSEVSGSKEAAGAQNIKSLNIRFTAGKSLRDTLNAATYIPAESPVTSS